MPHLRFRGMKKEEIKDISRGLVDELTEIIECPRGWFTLEHIETTFIYDEEEVKGYPFVEVLWFDRGQEVKDRAGKAVCDHVRKHHTEGEICVIFTNLEGKDYYENGEHF